MLGAGLLDAGLPGPVRAGFTRRRPGSSSGPFEAGNLSLSVGDGAAPANRAQLRASLGAVAGRLVGAGQVHGAEVAVAGPDDAGRELPGVDALVTVTAGLPLLVLAADCMPVLFADPVGRVVAAAHAGRPGLVAGVLQATVAAMVALGADAGRIVACVGPCIGGCCYELPAELAAAVGAAVPGAAARTTWDTPSVDLRAGADAVLTGLVASVHHVGGC